MENNPTASLGIWICVLGHSIQHSSTCLNVSCCAKLAPGLLFKKLEHKRANAAGGTLDVEWSPPIQCLRASQGVCPTLCEVNKCYSDLGNIQALRLFFKDMRIAHSTQSLWQ